VLFENLLPELFACFVYFVSFVLFVVKDLGR